jgi:hypothetical protein
VAPGRPLESWKNARIGIHLAYQYDDKSETEATAVWRARRGPQPALAAE